MFAQWGMPSFSGRILTVVWSGLLASVITIVGAGIWIALLTANLKTSPVIPWAVPVMALVLWLLWQYLGGKGWPRGTAGVRRSLLRANPVSRRTFAWALAAGTLALVALAGFWIVLVELTKVGGNPTLSTYAAYPPLSVFLALLMGSLVSPITEEAAFRGYCQALLEPRFRGTTAIAISSAYFALWHGPTQGFLWPKLLFYFLVGVTFGVMAYLTKSVLPSIPVHIMGDLTFFFVVWPHDAARPLVWHDGADVWFWLHVAQAIIFTALAIVAFRQLVRVTTGARATSHVPAALPSDILLAR